MAKMRKGRLDRRPLYGKSNSDTALLGGLRGRKYRNEGAPLEALGKGHAALGGGEDRVILADADALARPPLGAALSHDDVARHHALTAEFLDAKPPARAVAAIAGATTCFFMCHVVSPSSAFSQLLGLFDPAFALDPALEAQFLVELGDIRLGPCRDLGEARHAGGQEFLLQRRTHARQLLEIVRTRSRRCGLRLGLRLLRRGFLRRLGRDGRRCGPCAHGRLHARVVAARGQDLGDLHQRQLLAMALLALRAVLPAALDEMDELLALHLVDDQRLHGRAVHQGAAHHRCVAPEHENIVELDGFARIGRQLLNAQTVARLNLVLLAAGLHHREHARFLFVSRALWPRPPPLLGVMTGVPEVSPASDSAPPLGTSCLISAAVAKAPWHGSAVCLSRASMSRPRRAKPAPATSMRPRPR